MALIKVGIKGPPGDKGDQGDPGPPGPQGVPGIQGPQGYSLLSGTAVPTSGLGANGDTYINTSTGDLYFKSGGTWGSPVGSLRGQQGILGPRGYSILSGSALPVPALGADGDSYLHATTGDVYARVAGSWGTPVGNIQGIQGIQGPIGFSMLSGAGAPSNSLGTDGDTYINSSTGDVYTKASGIWGSPTGSIRGPQGVQGYSILTGIGAPSAGLGVNGDSYVNTSTGDVYTKSSGSWGSTIGNVRGPVGPGTFSVGFGLSGGAADGIILVWEQTDNATWSEAHVTLDMGPTGTMTITVKKNGSALMSWTVVAGATSGGTTGVWSAIKGDKMEISLSGSIGAVGVYGRLTGVAT